MAALTSSSGNDFYSLTVGSGASTVNDPGGSNDVIKIGTTTTALFARAGNDLVISFGTSDSVTVFGHFLADSSGVYTHAVEKLQYSTGFQVDLLNGISLNETGTSGNDTMLGWTGKDAINAGLGDDVIYGGTGASMLNGGGGNDSVYGGNAGNTEYGGGGNDLIVGGNGNDLLYGDGGNDSMIGGKGDDTYAVDSVADVVTENPGEGIDTVQASITYTLDANVENLTLTGSSAISGFGNSLDNVITGNAAANVLDGAGGHDTLAGGSGNDIYIVSNDGVSIVEAAGGGTDTVQASVSVTLAANVENLTLAGSANINGIGNASANVINGNAGNNILDGVSGQDTILGGAGNDSIVVHVGQSTGSFAGNAGTDTLVLDVDSAHYNDALRSDVQGLANWMAVQAANAGSSAALANLSGGPVYSLGSASVSVSTFEAVKILLNGNDVSIADFINRAPDISGVGTTSALTVAHNAMVTGQITASDWNGDLLSYGITQGPAHGTLTFLDDKGHYTYTAGDYVGSDSFTLKVDDGHGGVTLQNVSVTSTNAAPHTTDLTLSGTEAKPIAGSIQATDGEGDALSFALDTGPAHGTVTLDAATGAFVYTGTGNWSGNDAFTVSVSDGHGGTTASKVALAVAAAADMPTLLAADIVVDPSQLILAKDGGQKIVGGAGHDNIFGGSGNDTLSGGGSDGKSGTISVALDIKAALADDDGSEQLAVTIRGLPNSAHLSAGVLAADGAWHLSSADLDHLMLTGPDNAPMTLSITATATETSNGDAAETSTTITVTPQVASGPGGTGSDEIHGGAGHDLISGGNGADLLFGDAGNDLVKGDAGHDTLSGGDGNDVVQGGTGNDVLTGNAGNDTVSGGEGNDFVTVGEGNQSLNGGSGFDTLDFSKLSGKVFYDGGEHDVAVFGADGSVAYTMTAVSFEKIIGSDAGNYFDTTHKAGLGFIGGAGNDLFHIEGGNQTLTGGDGSDTYQWVRKFVAETPLNGGAERITDFRVGEDHLDLTDLLKGQGIKNAQFSDVVRVHESSDGKGALVQGLAGGQWHDIAKLEGVHNVTLADLGLTDHWTQPFAS